MANSRITEKVLNAKAIHDRQFEEGVKYIVPLTKSERDHLLKLLQNTTSDKTEGEE